VSDVNHAPLLTEPGAQTVKENEELKFKVMGSDEDTDNTLTYSAENLPDGASFDASSQEFSWKPGFEQAGDYNVTFKLNDGFQDVTVSSAVTVENVNRKPEISGPSSKEAEEGQSVQASFSASDADNDNLTFTADGLPSGASIDSGSGTISWQTSEGQAGSYSVTVKVSDGQDEASASLKIIITEKPAPPPPPAPADSTNN
jgi:hypothetical protein